MSGSRGYSFSWFVVGFLAGIAATLILLIFLGGRERRVPIEVSNPPVVTQRHHAEPAALPPRAPPQPEAAPQGPVDQQVAEDAAAAGMTSRSRSSPNQ